MKKPVPSCRSAHEKLLVSLRTGKAPGLSAAFTAHLRAAGVDGVVSLLGKDQFREAGADALFGSLGKLSHDPFTPTQPRVNMAYVFWPPGDAMPTARRVRQTLDEIDEAHAVGLMVLLHSGGVPSRAVMAAGCWLARNGDGASAGADLVAARHGWLRNSQGRVRRSTRHASLNEAQRAFIRDWPAGRHAEPVLGMTELLDETEPYPTATVEYWLRTLPTVRVYPEGRAGRAFEVPVEDAKRIKSGGTHLELGGLHAGTWIGERTLELLDGTVVVFISPFNKANN